MAEFWQNKMWSVERLNSQGSVSQDDARLAVLMDIREELQRVRSVLECTNCLRVPRILDRIAKNTAKKKRRAAK